MSQSRIFTMLDKIDSKLNIIESRLDSIDIKLAKYNSELEFHVARTNQIEEDLLPVMRSSEQVKGAVKAIGVLGAVSGLLAAIWQAFKA